MHASMHAPGRCLGARFAADQFVQPTHLVLPVEVLEGRILPEMQPQAVACRPAIKPGTIWFMPAPIQRLASNSTKFVDQL